MDAGASGVCFATVSTPSFLPGTLVTIGSFLKAHPQFAGDVVVIHDGLPEASRDALRLACPRVRFAPVSPALRDRVVALGAASPQFVSVLSHFWRVEAYRLTGYRKVLYCDSDLLFRRSISELFDAADPLICCGDGAFLRGRYRRAATFTETGDPDASLDRTFNDGFLLIDASLVGERTYAGLMALMTPEALRDVSGIHTAQVLHNRYFAGRQTLVSSTYNYLVGKADRIYAREGLAVRDAKVVHFVGPRKPWFLLGRSSMKPFSEPATRLWYDAWINALADICLRRRSCAPTEAPAQCRA